LDRPFERRRRREVLDPTAVRAHQVVVMLGRAPAVARFSVVGPQDVDLSHLGHGLQCSVDSREPDVGAGVSQTSVDVLGAAELIKGFQKLLNGTALSG
jgi:hypothetical protein